MYLPFAAVNLPYVYRYGKYCYCSKFTVWFTTSFTVFYNGGKKVVNTVDGKLTLTVGNPKWTWLCQTTKKDIE